MTEFKFHLRRSTLSKPYKCHLTYFYVNFFIIGTFCVGGMGGGQWKTHPEPKAWNITNSAAGTIYGRWVWQAARSSEIEADKRPPRVPDVSLGVQRHNMYIVHHQIEKNHLVGICTNHHQIEKYHLLWIYNTQENEICRDVAWRCWEGESADIEVCFRRISNAKKFIVSQNKSLNGQRLILVLITNPGMKTIKTS